MIHDGALIEFFLTPEQTTKPGGKPEISISFNGLVKHETLSEIVKFIREIQARDWNESVSVFALFHSVDE